MIINDLKNSFKQGNLLSRLIYINLGVFLLITIFNLFFLLFNLSGYQIIDLLALPAESKNLLSRPWTFITYMFVHGDLIHLIFNLLWLYFGGNIFLKYLSNKQIVSTYILGGLTGGLFYIIAYNYFPVFESVIALPLLGSSASVLAILIAIATYVPNYIVNLTFIGRVKLKHIAIVSIVLNLILIPQEKGGQTTALTTSILSFIAHLGGAFYGFYFSRQLLKGKDTSRWFNNLMDYLVNLFKPTKPLKTAYKRPMTDDQWRENKSNDQDKINEILDKIAKSGYESLNKEEKEILFKASKK
jgi:membrane associated rhomboid family serine protease